MIRPPSTTFRISKNLQITLNMGVLHTQTCICGNLVSCKPSYDTLKAVDSSTFQHTKLLRHPYE